MNRKTPLAVTLLLTAAIALPYSSATLAEQTDTQKLAQIVANIDHRPSAGDKKILREISTNGSEAERTIANALLQMSHSIPSADKEKLRMVTKDRNVPENTRVLATIVQNLNHHASDAEKKRLQEM